MSDEHSSDLRAAIAAAYDAEMAKAEPAAPEAPAAQPEAPARDDAGRFAPKEAEAEAPAAEPEADDYDEAVGLDRETWKLTPAQARERAKALAAEKRAAEERAAAYEPIDRVLAARRDALRATWGDEGRALEQLFHLSDWADRDFPGFVRHLAQQRGVDLRGLVPAQAEPAAQGQQDPVALIREEARREAERIVQERDTARLLSDFDRNAAFEHRHDPDVRRIMGGLLASGVVTELPAAYEMAVKAHPATAAKLAERDRAEQAKRAAEDAARRAAEKASAAVSVRGAPGTTGAAAARTAPATVRDAVLRAMEMAEGRV